VGAGGPVQHDDPAVGRLVPALVVGLDVLVEDRQDAAVQLGDVLRRPTIPWRRLGSADEGGPGRLVLIRSMNSRDVDQAVAEMVRVLTPYESRDWQARARSLNWSC